ncbi:MAG: AlpA family phage regulatory protein, partial [Gammaproteobacteria bacterium]|nr:AlpA family phage regulatory protein [Gammaproteobacteria bacterium]
MTRKPRKKRTRPTTRLLRVSEVQALTGLARSTIYAWSAQG